MPQPALELLDAMLELDPSKRITAQDALKSIWLRNVDPEKIIPPVLPNVDCHEMWSKKRKKERRSGTSSKQDNTANACGDAGTNKQNTDNKADQVSANKEPVIPGLDFTSGSNKSTPTKLPRPSSTSSQQSSRGDEKAAAGPPGVFGQLDIKTLITNGRAPTMEELADRLNVPLETIDDATKQLLRNLTLQLGMVARKTGEVSSQDPSVPPELRPSSQSHIPPELRSQSSAAISGQWNQQNNMPPELRNTSLNQSHSQNDYNVRGGRSDKNESIEDNYCTSYPPPELEDQNHGSTVANRLSAPVTVEYGHGRQSKKDVVTSESILESLKTDVITASAFNNGGGSADMALLSGSNLPLKDKVRGLTQHVRNEIGSRPTNTNTSNSQPNSGNGFIPRQIKGRSSQGSSNAHHGYGKMHRPGNQSQAHVGPRSNHPPPRSHNISRKY